MGYYSLQIIYAADHTIITGCGQLFVMLSGAKPNLAKDDDYLT